MLKVTAMSRWQAFRWLWRKDPEARWLWLMAFIRGSQLQKDVAINLRDFGV